MSEIPQPAPQLRFRKTRRGASHVTEREPNEAIEGYAHVSTSPNGKYRSTSTYESPFSQRKFKDQLSKRQRRKHNKAVNRATREAGE